ncbi:hypothetical protein H7F33_13410 [Pedobacter sp. PAMC26386]|nr:hypothetical protein H7F33_13410 [Pedobacter sp. PAMC26386]
MNQNDLNLDYDGNDVCITIKSKVNLALQIFLIGSCFALAGITILAIILNILAFIFAAVILLLFFLRYTLWNLYGAERVTVNKRLITSYHSCLFFKTGLRTKRIGKKLRMIPYELYGQGKQKMVNVVFEVSNGENVQENAYEFSLPVRIEQAEMISYMLSLLYLNKISFDFNRTKMCMN